MAPFQRGSSMTMEVQLPRRKLTVPPGTKKVSSSTTSVRWNLGALFFGHVASSRLFPSHPVFHFYSKSRRCLSAVMHGLTVVMILGSTCTVRPEPFASIESARHNSVLRIQAGCSSIGPYGTETDANTVRDSYKAQGRNARTVKGKNGEWFVKVCG